MEVDDIAKNTKGIRHQKKEITRMQVLRAAVELFLTQGYHDTTAAQIAEKVGRSTAAMFRAFPDKEAILYTLVVHMFGSQFRDVRKLLEEQSDPLLVYGAETALQLHICELSEPLRDLYVTAYTLPTTSEFIFQNTAAELRNIFGEYLPEASASDFYELEIASGGIMRSFMAHPCSMYFTIERKLRLFLSCSMKIYDIPAEKQEEVIRKVLEMDIAAMARQMIAETVRQVEAGLSEEE